jgi:hypothetical protein
LRTDDDENEEQAMTTVFLSGSRKINRLNDMVRSRIQGILDQGFDIVVGDANGADKAMQAYLAERGYGNVSVFCSGRVCRNNVGGWAVREVTVDPKLKGRAFYTRKDKEMAAQADCGLVLWDGKSAGSIGNVFELLKQGKKAAVYDSRRRRFVTVGNLEDIDGLIQDCDPADYKKIKQTIGTNRQVRTVHVNAQGALNL